MPCSRCNRRGHNARNRFCPANFPEMAIPPEMARAPPAIMAPPPPAIMAPAPPAIMAVPLAMPSININQPIINIDPHANALIEFVRTFENIPPRLRVTFPQIDDVYNFYEMPNNLMEHPIANRRIIENFINPLTLTVRMRRIGGNHMVMLSVHNRSQRGFSVLSGIPYPRNELVYLLIPQVIGLTVREIRQEEYHVYRAHVGHLVRTPRRLASSYVKEWKLVVDLTSQADTTCLNECSICIETKPVTHFAKTNCNHEYCLDCVKSHIQSNQNKTTKIVCPLCRSDLTNISLTDINIHANLQNFIASL